MERLKVADGVLRVDPAPSAKSVHTWIDELDLWQSAHFRHNPCGAGAIHLTGAQTMVNEVRMAISTNDAERAAWAGMKLMHEMWMAQTRDAFPMIDAGVTAFRKAEGENLKRHREATELHAQWQSKADDIWVDHPDWSASQVASCIDDPSGRSTGTIRKNIHKK